MAGTSTSVVLAALFANGAIAVLKFGAFLLTGSPAMLSETYHSVSDTGNQVFLLVGIRYGARKADRVHPFGYGKAQFFYSFLVSVLLFGIAGWESMKNGYGAIVGGETHSLHGTVTVFGETYPAVYVSYAVLVGAMGFETYAWMKAYRAMKAEIDEEGYSGFVEAFRKTSNVTTLTALTEDTIALLGLGFALIGIYLTQATGDAIFDAMAAVAIGLMLMGFALALAWENKRLLLGESLPRQREATIRAIIQGWEGVEGIEDFRTVHFGPDKVVVTADVVFEEHLDTEELDEAITGIEVAIEEADPDVAKVYIEPEVGPAAGAGDEDPESS